MNQLEMEDGSVTLVHVRAVIQIEGGQAVSREITETPMGTSHDFGQSAQAVNISQQINEAKTKQAELKGALDKTSTAMQKEAAAAQQAAKANEQLGKSSKDSANAAKEQSDAQMKAAAAHAAVAAAAAAAVNKITAALQAGLNAYNESVAAQEMLAGASRQVGIELDATTEAARGLAEDGLAATGIDGEGRAYSNSLPALDDYIAAKERQLEVERQLDNLFKAQQFGAAKQEYEDARRVAEAYVDQGKAIAGAAGALKVMTQELERASKITGLDQESLFLFGGIDTGKVDELAGVYRAMFQRIVDEVDGGKELLMREMQVSEKDLSSALDAYAQIFANAPRDVLLPTGRSFRDLYNALAQDIGDTTVLNKATLESEKSMSEAKKKLVDSVSGIVDSVVAEGEYENRLYQVYYADDQSVSGWARSETVADCGNEGSVVRLRELSLQKIADLEKYQSLTLQIIPGMVSANLGDIPTVYLPEIGANYDLTITDLKLTWNGMQRRIEATLGKPPRTLTSQLQRARRLQNIT